MLKNFIRLYIFLAIVSTLFVFNVEEIVDTLFQSKITELNNKLLSGPFYLVKKQLYEKPASEWPDIIDDLQIYFGYPITIKEITEFKLTPEEQKHLSSEKYLATDHDDEYVWYSLLKDNIHALSLEMSESLTAENHRGAKGIFYLLSNYIREKPEADWKKQVDKLQLEFEFPIQLLDINALELDEELMAMLELNKVIGINSDSLNESYLMKIKGSDYVIKAGPLFTKDKIVIEYITIIAILLFAGMIALTLYIWMRPIWRDITILDNVATNFGQGKFQSRANLPKRSAIRHLSNTFDNMAERINKLINSHKDLTNAVSHELRTPISRLRFAIEMLNETKDEKSKQRFIDSMNIDIDELELLVSELLSYARFDRENPRLESIDVNIQTWLAEIVDKIKTENNYTILNYINADNNQAKMVDFDQKLIERALNNLIRNAVRYTSSRIDISLEFSDQYCSIIIDDDGPGIPLEDRQRMLEPFTRLDTSRNKKSGGYGLGLSIVQQIIKWHSGSVTIAESSYGGASFCINLPLTGDKQRNDDVYK